jgi:hypothetical protein
LPEPIAGPALLARILGSGLPGFDIHISVGRILIYEALFNRWLVRHRSDVSIDDLTDLFLGLDEAWPEVNREWHVLLATAAAMSSERISAAGGEAGGRERELMELERKSGLPEARSRLGSALSAVEECYRKEHHYDSWFAGFSLGN